MGCTVASSPDQKEVNKRPKLNEPPTPNNIPFVYTFHSSSLLVQPLGLFGTEAFSIPLGFSIPCGAASATLGNSLFITGGKTAEVSKETSEIRIDFTKCAGQFQYQNNMQVPRHLHSVVALNVQKLLAISGVSVSEETVASCEVYNAKNGEWKRVSGVLYKRKSFAACRFAGELVYVFGGVDVAPVTQIEVYDIKKNTWSEIELAGNAWPGGENLGAVQIDKKILIFGGVDSDGATNYYFENKAMKKLTSASSLIKSEPLSLSNTSSIAQHRGRIYCTVKAKVFIFTIAAQRWNEVDINN
eukprot:TRINITY_DN7591_c0_g1_i1.p1 TRINITY_DN7591_c0_g1~~TRINITY_DN7591_c0_g1_i1.p1  ORF type:complete len:300 (-),score=23.74 TRINITY_DN7591_c0_g1_i1:144-1043(-)